MHVRCTKPRPLIQNLLCGCVFWWFLYIPFLLTGSTMLFHFGSPLTQFIFAHVSEKLILLNHRYSPWHLLVTKVASGREPLTSMGITVIWWRHHWCTLGLQPAQNFGCIIGWQFCWRNLTSGGRLRCCGARVGVADLNHCSVHRALVLKCDRINGVVDLNHCSTHRTSIRLLTSITVLSTWPWFWNLTELMGLLTSDTVLCTWPWFWHVNIFIGYVQQVMFSLVGQQYCARSTWGEVGRLGQWGGGCWPQSLFCAQGFGSEMSPKQIIKYIRSVTQNHNHATTKPNHFYLRKRHLRPPIQASSWPHRPWHRHPPVIHTATIWAIVQGGGAIVNGLGVAVASIPVVVVVGGSGGLGGVHLWQHVGGGTQGKTFQPSLLALEQQELLDTGCTWDHRVWSCSGIPQLNTLEVSQYMQSYSDKHIPQGKRIACMTYRLACHSKSHFWDCVLCNCLEDITDQFATECNICLSLRQRPIWV